MNIYRLNRLGWKHIINTINTIETRKLINKIVNHKKQPHLSLASAEFRTPIYFSTHFTLYKYDIYSILDCSPRAECALILRPRPFELLVSEKWVHGGLICTYTVIDKVFTGLYLKKNFFFSLTVWRTKYKIFIGSVFVTNLYGFKFDRSETL